MTTQTTPQKSSIKQRLRTDLGRSVGVTKATQLVWLTGLRAHLPTNRNSRYVKIWCYIVSRIFNKRNPRLDQIISFPREQRKQNALDRQYDIGIIEKEKKGDIGLSPMT